MKNKLQILKDEILNSLSTVVDLNALQDLENKYLGRKGEMTAILRSLSELAEGERKEIGALANEIKIELQDKFNALRLKLNSSAQIKTAVDVTLPGKKILKGHLHPLTIVQQELEDFFATMGFMTLDGPELESDYYCFEALNLPPHHPARDMQDTFYIDKKNKAGDYDMVMRTQTSAVQVRAMQKFGAPLKCIIPGRCFRCEATDVRHEHTFYQLEGLMVDKNINMSHLKGVLEAMARHLYGPETQVRLRPKYYPFVEPGVNGEVTCMLCHGQGCRLCKHTGWLEIFGAGMVHPNVLIAGKVDSDIYQGFAFGFGLNRVVQLKYNIEDIRLFNGGDMRFLEQF